VVDANCFVIEQSSKACPDDAELLRPVWSVVADDEGPVGHPGNDPRAAEVPAIGARMTLTSAGDRLGLA
jgi:hypothetical protein